jgi:hypothetical protein
LIPGCAAALILDSGLLSDAISDSPPEKSAFSQKKTKKLSSRRRPREKRENKQKNPTFCGGILKNMEGLRHPQIF